MLISAKKRPRSKRMRKRWIAERRLERRDAVGGVVVVRIGSPEWPPGAEEWRCPFVILGLDNDSIQFGRGEETMSALINALTGIHYELEQSGIPLRWEGADEDITGFSKYVTWVYGRAFQQRLETMLLEEETEHVNRQLEARRQKKRP